MFQALAPICSCTTTRKICREDTGCYEPQWEGTMTTYYYDCSTSELCGTSKGSKCMCLK